MSFHTIGNSHCVDGWHNLPVTKHHLGPVLCYSFATEKLKRINLKDHQIVSGDTVIFCFGEIDCRCHVHKHVTEDKSYQQIIDNIVNGYFEAIQENKDQFESLNIWVFNLPPPVETHNTEEDSSYPFIGSDEERKSYVLYFNECLKYKCQAYKYGYFDIYDKYTDNNGFLNKLLSDNRVHIRDPKYLEEFFNENVRL